MTPRPTPLLPNATVSGTTVVTLAVAVLWAWLVLAIPGILVTWLCRRRRVRRDGWA